MAIGKIYIADVFLKIGGTSSQYLMSDGSVSNIIDVSGKANVVSPTFSGTVTLPSTTSIGNVSSTEIGFIDGVTSGVQAQLNTKITANTSTNNYIPKVSGTNTFANSRILDDGTYLGIGTANYPTKDITFGNQSNREIGIEQSSNSTAGRDLILSSGRTINYNNPNFISINQPIKTFAHIAGAPNGTMYVTTFSGNSAIYKKLPNDSIFLDTGFIFGQATGITVAPNLDVYVTQWNGGTYFQAGGTGVFSSISSPGGQMSAMAAAPNGNIYLTVNQGDIYMRVGGTGSFVALGEAIRGWQGIAAAPNGNIYACVNGDIYMQTNGLGNFLALNQTSRNWKDITVAPNGNVYAVDGVNIYMQTGGSGNFISLNQTTLNWSSIGSDINGNIYASDAQWYTPSDMYYQNNNVTGTADLNGGTLKLYVGTGKGIGNSDLEIYTGQKTNSGTDMQSPTLRVRINNEGLMTLPSVTNALITTDVTGKAVITKEYLNSINEPLQIIISTTSSFTTDTLDSNYKSQSGKNVIIDNGSNVINITVNGGSNFVASYLKHGSGLITFVQGSGRTLVQVDGTAVFNGALGSTAAISSIGSTDYLRISNA
jgi:hypothetical protein